jgi:hemerythrin-like domain-containing protein
MASATQVLMDEHRGIERMLGALERELPRLEAGDGSAVELFAQGADFLRNFADRCHHHKEEQLLFPALAERGVGVEGGPIAAYLADHARGRDELAAMSAAIERYGEGDRAALADLAAATREYVDLLRTHIRKEDESLFRTADELFTPDEQARLVEEFDRVEEEVIGAGTHERYHRMLDAL